MRNPYSFLFEFLHRSFSLPEKTETPNCIYNGAVEGIRGNISGKQLPECFNEEGGCKDSKPASGSSKSLVSKQTSKREKVERRPFGDECNARQTYREHGTSIFLCKILLLSRLFHTRFLPLHFDHNNMQDLFDFIKIR